MEIDTETRPENPGVQRVDGHIFKKWCRLFWQAGDAVGRTFRIARDMQMERLMGGAGFAAIHHRE
jgi:hypothetical protein